MKEISVLIVSNRRPAKLKRLLESIVKFAQAEKTETLVLINGEDKETESLVNDFSALRPDVRYFKTPGLNRGEARNFLIKNSNGRILYFLDDDVLIKNDVFTLIADKFRSFRDISIIGGPNLNMPGSSLFQQCQGFALASFFGTLWISRRYKKSGQERLVDESGLILCNLAAEKDIFIKTDMRFPDNFSAAEENLLLARLARLGYKAMYIPRLEVFHERRATYGEFFKQIFTYGKGRVQIFKSFPSYINPVHFLPVILLLCLAAAPFIKSRLYWSILMIYPVMDIFFSSLISFKKRDLRIFFILLFIFPTIHLAYALAFLLEILRRERRISL
ncbi:MAG: glycosyltransferase [Candidatus Omnitrophica bacterium]|nr:glycosyltransferase [Candidatus Omnitrophota bacterium]